MRTPETYPLEGELEDIEARLSYLGISGGSIHRYMHHPPIDPIAFLSLCLKTSSLTPLSGIKLLGPAVTESTVNPIPVVAVESTGIVSTTGSAFNGGGCAVDDGIFWTISVQIARRCHRRLLVNCPLDGIGQRMKRPTRPRPPFGPIFSHLLSPYTHPSASVA